MKVTTHLKIHCLSSWCDFVLHSTGGKNIITLFFSPAWAARPKALLVTYRAYVLLFMA
jgi:hypothetical protein